MLAYLNNPHETERERDRQTERERDRQREREGEIMNTIENPS